MPITISEAQTIIDGAIAKAKELNVKVTVAVVDGGGKIVAVNKMDGSHWAGTYGAIGKAVGASAFGRPTGEMQDQAFSPTPSGVRERSGGEMILGQGGIPINRDGFIEVDVGLVVAFLHRMKNVPGLESSALWVMTMYRVSMTRRIK